MSERVERKILAMLPDHAESPYGNPIPGLDELGDLTELADFRYGLTSLDVMAAAEPTTVVVRRIGEPVQVDSEALGLLTAAGLMPGQPARVRRDGARVIAFRDGAEESSGRLAARRHRLARLRPGHLSAAVATRPAAGADGRDPGLIPAGAPGPGRRGIRTGQAALQVSAASTRDESAVTGM